MPLCSTARLCLLTAFVWLVFLVPPLRADAKTARRAFDIPEGAAEQTLKRFSEQSGHSVIAPTHLLKDVRTLAVHGEYTAREAIERMLGKSGLEVRPDAATGAFAIVRPVKNPPALSPKHQGSVSTPAPPSLPAPPSAETKPMTKPRSQLLAALVSLFAVDSASSQTPTPDASRPPDTVALSPFEVVANNDGSWYATNSVGATRFNTPLAEVPLTINVVTSEFIQTIGATNLAEAVRYSTGVVPGASGPTQGGAGSNFTEVFMIRGLPVRFVFRDGTRNWRGNEPLFMDRVEVLKGPTAILYGESLPGGTLNYVTKMPQRESGGSVGVSFDSHGAYRSDIDATGSLDRRGVVSYRFIAGYQGGSSFIDHMKLDYKPFLGSVLIRPWTGTRVYVGIESLHRRIDGPQSNGTIAWRGPLNEGRVNPLSGGTGQPTGISPYASPGTNPWGDPVLGSYFDQRVSNYTATWEQNLAKDLDFRSSWNYAKTPQDGLTLGNNDTNVIDAPLVDPTTRAAIVAAPGATITYLGHPYVVGQGSTLAGNPVSNATPGAFQGGIRRVAAYVSGPGSGPVRFVGNNLSRAGFFDPNVVGPRAFSYFGNENRETNWKTDVTYKRDFGNSTHRVLLGYEYYRGSYRNRRTVANPAWTGNNADGVAGNISGGYVQDIFGNRWTRAAPANNAFAPGSDISRDGGDSYYGTYLGQFLDKRLNTLVGFRSADLFTSDFNSPVRNHFKKTVPQYGALFKISEDVGLYGSYSKSFRLNNERFTINPPASSNPNAYTPSASFPPQEGRGIDIGLKFQLLGRRLSGNLTYFDIDYTEIPITSNTVLDDKGNFVRFPGGAQSSRGQELEIFYTPFDQLQLTAGLTRLDAEYTVVTRGQEYLLGKRLATTREWQASLFARYRFASGGLKGLSIGAGGYRLGEGAQGDLPRFPPAGYTVFDLVASYAHKVAGVPVTYALNLTNVADKEYYQDFTNPHPPRTLTLSTRVQF